MNRKYFRYFFFVLALLSYVFALFFIPMWMFLCRCWYYFILKKDQWHEVDTDSEYFLLFIFILHKRFRLNMPFLFIYSHLYSDYYLAIVLNESRFFSLLIFLVYDLLFVALYHFTHLRKWFHCITFSLWLVENCYCSDYYWRFLCLNNNNNMIQRYVFVSSSIYLFFFFIVKLSPCGFIIANFYCYQNLLCLLYVFAFEYTSTTSKSVDILHFKRKCDHFSRYRIAKAHFIYCLFMAYCSEPYVKNSKVRIFLFYSLIFFILLLYFRYTKHKCRDTFSLSLFLLTLLLIDFTHFEHWKSRK